MYKIEPESSSLGTHLCLSQRKRPSNLGECHPQTKKRTNFNPWIIIVQQDKRGVESKKKAMDSCAKYGCDQPGTNQCSACKNKFYCSPTCQKADWPQHKEECPGYLRKVGMANLVKATRYEQEQNWPQVLRYAEIAATKLKQLKDCPIEAIDDALRMKFTSLNLLSRDREALECAKEWYCMYLTNHTHPPAIKAGFALIESCIHNKEFFDAVVYARTTWETITLSRDSHIPDNEREWFIATGARTLSKSLQNLVKSGDMPQEEKQEAGLEAITLARRALEVDSQLHGRDCEYVAEDLAILASVLDTFSDYEDDEALRRYEQSNLIHTRENGGLSVNVAAIQFNLGASYYNRARRAKHANDMDRASAYYELALRCSLCPHHLGDHHP